MEPSGKSDQELKALLTTRLKRPLAKLARRCAAVWSDTDAVEAILVDSINGMPLYGTLCAVNRWGTQLSSNVTSSKIDRRQRGCDLSGWPFFDDALPYSGLLLSKARRNELNGRVCMTAMHAVTAEGQILGYIAADIDLRNPRLRPQSKGALATWRQIRGDPGIRNTVFQRKRVRSRMDKHIDEVLQIVNTLICDRGVFDCRLDFARSAMIVWLVDQPRHYRVHVLDEIIDPAVCLSLPSRTYPEEAIVEPAAVCRVLERLNVLREADDNIYLRSGSLNVINGMVELSFSCDGLHYMSVEEFLDKDELFWFGSYAKVS